MTIGTDENVSKTFKFSYPMCTNEELFYNLEVPVEIPYDGSTRELVQRVINMFHIPVYLEDELNEQLAHFVSEETETFHNERDDRLINQLKNAEINVEDVVKNWEKLFKENVVEFAEDKGTSDEEVFAMAYHKLVHSPALETILQVEATYARTVHETLRNRDEDIKKLTQSQIDEMEEKMRHLNAGTTEEDINDLAARQFESQSLVAGRWGSQLDALWQSQRAEYRAWLMSTLDQLGTAESLLTPSNSPLGTFTGSFPAPRSPPPRLEESFTIHLGCQLKQTHNLRIVAMDMMEVCRAKGDCAGAQAGIQTALSLYSPELSAAALLTDAPPAPPLAHTEYHFRDASAQIDEITERMKETSLSGGGRARPRPGDVLVTRHSNLAEVHVLFHMLVDKTVKNADMNSRHPVILGLRNILKTACCNDVTSVYIPLLLKHELSDEMTAAWCMRRAELVLKCVKGFMLEAASWGGAELRGLQFVLPAGLSEELFHSLAGLLPSIFRISKPVKFVSESVAGD